MLKNKIKNWFPVSLIFLTLLLDQISKYLIVQTITEGEKLSVVGSFIRLHLVENPGMAFGLFSNIPAPFNHIVFSTLTIVAIVFVIIYFINVQKEKYQLKCAFGLIIGGAIGNFLDRIFGNIFFHQATDFFYGKVIDFIDIGIEENPDPGSFTRWPTFNVADAAITIGVAMLIFYILFNRKEKIFKDNSKTS